MIECLGSRQGTGGIGIDIGQQADDAVLVVVKHLFQKHVVHRQGQVLYCHAYLVVRLLVVDGFQDAVPLLVAGHEVVLHHLLCLEVGVLPDNHHHDNEGKSEE